MGPGSRSRRSNPMGQDPEDQDEGQEPSSQVDELMSNQDNQDQEQDEHQEGDEEDQDGSIRSRKKPRRDQQDGDEELQGQDQDDQDQQGNPLEISMAQRAARMQSQRSKEGYLPGAIVRIKLENFVTYSHTEFYPGPYLNMIIGPNGTGKSTIVCAIALGLGFPTRILGRAKDSASFVKKGTEEGYVEIELKGRTGEANVVVKRVLNREDNSSEWFLNGEKTTLRECITARNALDIQVDNLCSFLPQDKVADFARMAPPELLRETEKAAGEKDLIVWHQKLTDLGTQLRLQSVKLDSEIGEMENLEERNHALERDVRRYEERQRIERKIEILSVRMPFAEYTQAKKVYDRNKIEARDCKRELERLRLESQPIMDELEKIREHFDKLKLKKEISMKKVKEEERELKKLIGNLEEIEAKSDNLMNEFSSFNKREQNRKKKLKDLQDAIDKLQHRIDNEPERVDTSTFEKRIRELGREKRDISSELEELEAEQDEISTACKAFMQARDDITRKLSNLDNQKLARMGFLKNEPDTVKALEWLRSNKAMFQAKIHEPVMLEVSVKDPKWARAAENVIPWPVMKTFVCENREDHDLFWKEMEKRKIRINTADVSGLEGLGSHRPPLPVEQIRQLGFDNYLANLINAPDAVLNYLCHNCNLHRIPVALDENKVDLQSVEKTNLARFITGTTISTVTRSNYGSRAAQISSYEGSNHGTFRNVVDPNLKPNLEKQMLGNVNQVTQKEAKHKELAKEIEKLTKKEAANKAERAQVEEKKKEAGQARAAWERAKVDLKTKEKELQKQRKAPSVKQEQEACGKKLEEISAKRFRLVKESKNLLKAMLATRYEYDSWALQLAQHEIMLRYVEDIATKARHSFKDAEKAALEAKNQYNSSKVRATTLFKKATELLHSSAPDLVEIVQSLPKEEMERDLESLQAEIEAERASLELAQGVNPAVIEQYKERLEKLKRLKTSVEEKEKEKADVVHQIKKLESKWIPSLETLAERVSQKFSASFARLGCAGEVRISRDEDYSKWGIDILVKFRETEQLTLLTGTRQSGGERSLSTIMYLMSLLQLAVAPFSVVDEINQGMDQRAERAVHDHMVQVTCRPEASQYFLITPKLLSNLTYHERMKVLVINNGPWLPESKKLDFKNYAKTALARRQAVR